MRYNTIKEVMIVEIALIVIGVLVFIMLAVRFAMWFQWFSRELRHVNKEIDRTDGKEREHWKKRKKRLLRSIIPFVGY